MALGCDSPTLPASRNRLYWTRIPPWASRVLEINTISTQYPSKTPKWNFRRWRSVPRFVMVRSDRCDFWEAHPQQKIPVLDGWQSINLQIFPDESSWLTGTTVQPLLARVANGAEDLRVFDQIYTTTMTTMSWGEVYRILIVWFPVPSFCVISMFVCRAMISMAKILDLQDMNYMNPCKSLGRFNPLPINVRRHMAFQNISATSEYHSMFLPHSTWFSSNGNPLVGPLVGWMRKEMKTVAYYIKMCL